MNNKGVTMVTVVVMIIVMLIIATVSIVAGNKLIVNSNEYKTEQEMQSVKAAILRRKSEVNMSGTLKPIGATYAGTVNPVLSSDDGETITATGWYLLDENNLEQLGVYDVTSRYLVNYDYEVVLQTKNDEYLEEYMVVEFIQEFIKNNAATGTQLKNKTTNDESGKMIKNNKTNETFGTGWYVVAQSDFTAKYSKYIENDYLINYGTAKYVKMDSSFVEM